MTATAKVPLEKDPRDDPVAFAHRIGELQEDAEICSAPPKTYQPVMSDALALLPHLYSEAGINPSDVGNTVATAKSGKLVLHQEYPQTTNCRAFRMYVSYIQRSILIAKGMPMEALPPVAPPDPKGWQEQFEK
jgi:hypothetical protein